MRLLGNSGYGATLGESFSWPYPFGILTLIGTGPREVLESRLEGFEVLGFRGFSGACRGLGFRVLGVQGFRVLGVQGFRGLGV